jgi:hypothetical protein
MFPLVTRRTRSPEAHRILNTECLRKWLLARAVQHLIVRVDSKEHVVLAPGKVYVQQRVPLVQCSCNLGNKQLCPTGGRVVTRLERRPWRRGLGTATLWWHWQGQVQADALCLDHEFSL